MVILKAGSAPARNSEILSAGFLCAAISRARRVAADKIQAIIDSMVVWIFRKIGFVPAFEISTQHHADFEMEYDRVRGQCPLP